MSSTRKATKINYICDINLFILNDLCNEVINTLNK
jgi:hypothetical protein